jgi:hypothetical protein
MALRPDERVAIDELVALFSCERRTSFKKIDVPDPPDWVGEDCTTKEIIDIEHTRIEPRDLESLDRWHQFGDAVRERARGRVPGVFFIGPARPDRRFPTIKKVPLASVAQRVVDMTVQHPWSTPGEAWEVSPTAAPLPKFWMKVMFGSRDGSEMVPLMPFGRRPLQEVIERFRGAVERKTSDLHEKATHANEHYLLIDAVTVHPAALGSYEANLADVMEFRRLKSLPVPTAVCFREKVRDATTMRRVWP